MLSVKRECLWVRVTVFAASSTAWLVLLLSVEGLTLPVACASSTAGLLQIANSLDLVLALNPPATLLTNWALMLTAMMGPLLVGPLSHMSSQNSNQRRTLAIPLFTFGYTVIWMAAGTFLTSLALVLQSINAGAASTIALTTVAALALHLSSFQRRCLEGCRNHSSLVVRKGAIGLSPLRSGLRHGAWCVGSCWLPMLLCLLSPRNHVAAMAVAATWIYAERVHHLSARRWRSRFLSRPLRVAAVRIMTRFDSYVMRQPTSNWIRQ